VTRTVRHLLLALALTLAPVTAGAGEPTTAESASDHFKRGVQFYRERDFRNALIEFKRAYEIEPNYAVLFNLGQTSFELKDYVEAQRAFTAYLEQGKSEIPPDRRKEVEGELEKLETYVARIDLKVNVAGAEVAIDDVVVGKTPLGEPLLVSAGRRKVSVRKDGYAPLTQYIDIGGGDAREVPLSLTSLEARPAPAPAPLPVSPDEPEESDHVAFWVSLSTTVGFGIATGVLGGLALKADGDYEDELGTFPNTKPSIDDAADRVTTFAVLTDVFAGLTGASALATVIFAITEFGLSDGGEEEALRVEIAPGGARLSGRF
jgi:hypothetical protein